MARTEPKIDTAYYDIEIGSHGTVRLPVSVCELLGLEEGDTFVVIRDADDTRKLAPLRDQLLKTRGMFKHLVPPGVSVVDEFIQERREEARREEEEARGIGLPDGRTRCLSSPSLALGKSGEGVVRQQLSAGAAYISAVNWAECLTTLSDRGTDAEAVAEMLADRGVTGDVLSVVAFDEVQSRRAAALRRSTRSAGFSLGDRACIALAGMLNLPVLTADRAWATLALAVEVRLIR